MNYEMRLSIQHSAFSIQPLVHALAMTDSVVQAHLAPRPSPLAPRPSPLL